MPIEDDVARLKWMVALLMHYAPLEVRQKMLDDMDDAEFGSVSHMTGLVTADGFRAMDLEGDGAVRVFKTMSPHHQFSALFCRTPAEYPIECFRIVFNQLDKADVRHRTNLIEWTFDYSDADLASISFDHVGFHRDYIDVGDFSRWCNFERNKKKRTRFYRRVAQELVRCIWKMPVACLTRSVLSFLFPNLIT